MYATVKNETVEFSILTFYNGVARYPDRRPVGPPFCSKSSCLVLIDSGLLTGPISAKELPPSAKLCHGHLTVKPDGGFRFVSNPATFGERLKQPGGLVEFLRFLHEEVGYSLLILEIIKSTVHVAFMLNSMFISSTVTCRNTNLSSTK